MKSVSIEKGNFNNAQIVFLLSMYHEGNINKRF